MKNKLSIIYLAICICFGIGCAKNDCAYETNCIETAPNGFMVGTMASDPQSLNKVATIFNTVNNASAPIGDDWNDPLLGINRVQRIFPKYWVSDSIGQVFGIALDLKGGIYLSATDVYKFDGIHVPPIPIGTIMPSGYGAAGAAGIYYTNYSSYNTTTPLVKTKLFPYTNTVGTALMPNSSSGVGNSIGNIAYDYTNNQLFATNLEDGRIYRINASTGIVKSIFDPFGIDAGNATPGIVGMGEQLWGVGVLTQAGITSVYFARSTGSATKEIWSIQLDASGEFLATPAGGGLYTQLTSTPTFKLQIATIPGVMDKVTDIAFSSTGKMLLAERGNPHKSGMYEYVFTGATWVAGNNFYLGGDLTSHGYLLGKNSAGGVDYSNREVKNGTPNFICNDIVWGSVNAAATIKLPFATGANYPNYVYGVQGIKSIGNNGTTLSINAANDLYIDYNCTGWPHTNAVKGKIGDVEFFDSQCPCK